MKITVVVCTFNPNIVYLARVIDSLKQQSLAKEEWEFIIVDNNSTNNFHNQIDLSWHPAARIIKEVKQGLTPSRIRGIEEAQSELLVLVDDDNILDTDFLKNAISISEKWPQLGVWGGNITGEFECVPEEWTKDYWYYLAIRETDKDYWSNDISAWRAEPCGAGLCMRKVVGARYIEELKEQPLRLKLDRIGNKLISGGDTDIVLTSLGMGLGMAVFKDLKLKHIMPASRLSEDYLLKLMEGLKFSHIVLAYLRNPEKELKKSGLMDEIRKVYYLATLKGRSRRFYKAKLEAEKDAAKYISNLITPN